MLKLSLDLDADSCEYLLQALEEAIDAAKEVLDEHLKDQTPETVTQYLALVGTQRERIAVLKQVLERIQELRGGDHDDDDPTH